MNASNPSPFFGNIQPKGFPRIDRHSPVSWRTALWRGARQLCPRCGQGKLFSGWYDPIPQCPVCGEIHEPGAGDTWGMTYLGTAFFTGLFLLVTFLVRMPRTRLEQAIYLAVAAALMVGTMPHRKGLALAADYLIRTHWERPNPPDGRS